jgi:hypothetical protein
MRTRSVIRAVCQEPAVRGPGGGGGGAGARSRRPVRISQVMVPVISAGAAGWSPMAVTAAALTARATAARRASRRGRPPRTRAAKRVTAAGDLLENRCETGRCPLVRPAARAAARSASASPCPDGVRSAV